MNAGDDGRWQLANRPLTPGIISVDTRTCLALRKFGSRKDFSNLTGGVAFNNVIFDGSLQTQT